MMRMSDIPLMSEIEWMVCDVHEGKAESDAVSLHMCSTDNYLVYAAWLHIGPVYPGVNISQGRLDVTEPHQAPS